MLNENIDKTDCALFEVSFEPEHPQGFVRSVKKIASQGPAVVYFPGSDISYHNSQQRDRLPPSINRLADILKHSLESVGLNQEIIQQTHFYFIAYNNPPSFSEQRAVDLLHQKYGRINKSKHQKNNLVNPEEANPSYIETLYSQIISPRISRLHGKMKLDAQTAEQNVGQLVFYTHCYGSYTTLKLEELMQQKMQNLGYNDEEIAKIQKQIVSSAYAPACPLGVSKMNSVYFKTLADNCLCGGNLGSDYLDGLINNERQYRNDLLEEGGSNHTPLDFQLSFYPEKLGNVFLIKEKFTYDPLKTTETSHMQDEHNHSFSQGDNKDAYIMQAMMRRCLANSILRAHKMQEKLLPPPSIQDLVVGEISQSPKADMLAFKHACFSGKKQYKKMLSDLHQSSQMLNSARRTI